MNIYYTNFVTISLLYT